MRLNAFERFIEKYPNGIGGKPWDINSLSMNPIVTPDFIEKHLDWKWDINYLSKNPSITPEFIKKHSDWKWNMYFISMNPNITSKIIEKYPNGIGSKLWDIAGISINPNITPEFLEKYPNGIGGKPWNINFLSLNPSITPEFIEKYPDWKWNIINLSCNRFTKSIKEDENNHKNKIYLIKGEEEKDTSLYNFKNNYLFDFHLNKLILSFLAN